MMKFEATDPLKHFEVQSCDNGVLILKRVSMENGMYIWNKESFVRYSEEYEVKRIAIVSSYLGGPKLSVNKDCHDLGIELVWVDQHELREDRKYIGEVELINKHLIPKGESPYCIPTNWEDLKFAELALPLLAAQAVKVAEIRALIKSDQKLIDEYPNAYYLVGFSPPYSAMRDALIGEPKYDSSKVRSLVFFSPDRTKCVLVTKSRRFTCSVDSSGSHCRVVDDQYPDAEFEIYCSTIVKFREHIPLRVNDPKIRYENLFERIKK
jgi:hypothetical protein